MNFITFTENDKRNNITECFKTSFWCKKHEKKPEVMNSTISIKFIDKWLLEFLIKNILMNNGCPLCRQLSPGRGLVWRVVWVRGPGHNLHHLQLFRGQYPAQGPLCEKDQTLQLPIHLSKSQRRWELIKNAVVIRICWHWKEVCSVFYGQHLQQYYKKCVANKIWLGQQFLKYLSFRELNLFPWVLHLSQEEFSNETFLWKFDETKCPAVFIYISSHHISIHTPVQYQRRPGEYICVAEFQK